MSNTSQHAFVGTWRFERVSVRDGRSQAVKGRILLNIVSPGHYEILRDLRGKTTIVRGTYALHGDRVSRWVESGLRLNDFSFRAEGDALHLISPDQTVFTFRRTEEDAGGAGSSATPDVSE